MRALMQAAAADPGGLVAVVGNQTVALTWTAVPGATGYTVLRGTTPTLSQTVATVGSGTLSYTDSAVANGTWYSYTVAANGTGKVTNACAVVPTAAGGSYNGYAALTVPTYDGSGQGTHPDVIDFGGKTVNGYRYWMAFTPYPSGNSNMENPSVVASTDGQTWQVPSGLTNPIDPQPGYGYNSDTDWAFADGTFYLYYRGTDNTTNDYVLARTSKDGVAWSNELAVFTKSFARALSPAVLRLPDGTWRMWLVDSVNNQVVTATSTDPLTGWSALTPVTIQTYGGGNSISPWHIDVEYYRGVYYMLLCERTAPGNERIAGATSVDGVIWTNVSRAFITSNGRWDSTAYRGSMSPSTDGLRWRVWYGATTGTGWGIGYTEVPMSEWPVPYA